MGIFSKNKQKPDNAYKPEYKQSNLQKIVQTSKYNIIPSVDQFIQAIKSSENKFIQSRIILYDHYDTTLKLDNFVQTLLNKRYQNIQSKIVNIEYDGEDYEYLNYFFTSPKFKSFMKDVLATQLWGFNTFEFDINEYDNKLWFDYYMFPHKHINPFSKEVLVNQWDSSGESFEDKDNILFFGDEEKLGLLSTITLLSIYRRYGMFNYSRYAELASENFTQIKTRGFTTDENLKSVEDQFLNRGNSSIMSMPEGVDIESESQSSSQQNDLFENYQKMVKEELAQLILGQTMTTSDGSSYTQAEVHSNEQQSVYDSDDNYMLDFFNFYFKNYINIWFPELDKTKVKFKFKTNNKVQLKEKLDEYKALKELGMAFTDQELREIFKDLL